MFTIETIMLADRFLGRQAQLRREADIERSLALARAGRTPDERPASPWRRALGRLRFGARRRDLSALDAPDAPSP